MTDRKNNNMIEKYDEIYFYESEYNIKINTFEDYIKNEESLQKKYVDNAIAFFRKKFENLKNNSHVPISKFIEDYFKQVFQVLSHNYSLRPWEDSTLYIKLKEKFNIK